MFNFTKYVNISFLFLEDFRQFKNIISQQMATIGGGGAVRLQDLDDVDTSSLGNGKFLV